MNILNLFDGISIGQLALNQLEIKYDNYYSSEIDEKAIKITNKNFPNTIHLGDVTKIDVESLPIMDLVMLGSPCQSFSNTGKKEGFNGKSGLFYDAVKIIKVLKEKNPSLSLLMENVRMKKEWEETITNELNTIFENINVNYINSSLFSAQNRPRIYWTTWEIKTPIVDKNIKIRDILEKDVNLKYYLSQRGIIGNIKSSFNDRQPKNIENKIGCLKLGGNKANIVQDWSYWENLKIDDVIDYKRLGARNLTPIEYERCQTIPDNYTKCDDISDTTRYNVIGNSWTLEVIKYLLNEKLDLQRT